MSKPKFVAAQSYPSAAIRVACERIAAGEDAQQVAQEYGWDSDAFEPLARIRGETRTVPKIISPQATIVPGSEYPHAMQAIQVQFDQLYAAHNELVEFVRCLVCEAIVRKMSDTEKEGQ